MLGDALTFEPPLLHDLPEGFIKQVGDPPMALPPDACRRSPASGIEAEEEEELDPEILRDTKVEEASTSPFLIFSPSSHP